MSRVCESPIGDGARGAGVEDDTICGPGRRSALFSNLCGSFQRTASRIRRRRIRVEAHVLDGKRIENVEWVVGH